MRLAARCSRQQRLQRSSSSGSSSLARAVGLPGARAVVLPIARNAVPRDCTRMGRNASLECSMTDWTCGNGSRRGCQLALLESEISTVSLGGGCRAAYWRLACRCFVSLLSSPIEQCLLHDGKSGRLCSLACTQATAAAMHSKASAPIDPPADCDAGHAAGSQASLRHPAPVRALYICISIRMTSSAAFSTHQSSYICKQAPTALSGPRPHACQSAVRTMAGKEEMGSRGNDHRAEASQGRRRRSRTLP